MKKFLLPVLLLLVGLGLGRFAIPKGAGPVGAYRQTFEHFVGGFYAGSTDQFYVDSSGNASTTGTLKVTGITNYGNSTSATLTVTSTTTSAFYNTATVGSSSTTPAALGSAAAGFFTATTTTQLASSTAITANSQIIFTPSPSSSAFTTLGVPCNTTAPSSTQVTKIWPGSGFQVQTNPAPSGTITPYCLSYHIVN